LVIHWQFYDGIPAPLAARVSLPFNLHVKGNYGKKENSIWVHEGSNPYHAKCQINA